MQIKSRWDGRIIFEDDAKTIRETVKNAVKNDSDLRGSDLSGSDLSGSDLSDSDLSGSDLSGSNFRGSDLSGSNFRGSDLRGSDLSDSDLSDSDLRGSDLRGSDLRGSDLRGSDLRGSDLRGSNLSGSNFRGSDLRGSNIEFYNLPSLRTLSSISLFNLPDNLQLELMRRDAQAHPHPELFDEWVKTKKCPYQNEERFWLFEPKPKLWKAGKPEMSDFDLIIALCKSQGWRVRGYLK